MKILVIADEESRYYYDYYSPGKLDEFDLILALGDLHKSYLEFLVTMAKCPLYYVKGNHDTRFEKDPPEGCICIDDQLVVYKGVRILGLGGSYKYFPDAPCMYTEREMRRRIRRLWLKIRRSKGFDILAAHAPALDHGDLEDVPHRGFKCFVDLMDKYRPKYFVHGHVHAAYDPSFQAFSKYKDTTIVNACGCRIIEL